MRRESFSRCSHVNGWWSVSSVNASVQVRPKIIDAIYDG